MKLNGIDQEGDHCRLEVEVTWEEIAPAYDDIVARYAKAPVRGFRAGKIPRHLVDKRFHKQINDDLFRLCANRFGREALHQSGFNAAGPLEVSDMVYTKGRPLGFTIRFLPLPEFDLPDIGTIRISPESRDPLSDISRWLLEHVAMTVPDALVRNELGVDGIDAAPPGSDQWSAAAERVKLMMILKAIAARDGIEVDETDVENRIREKAAEFATTPKKLRSQLEKGGGTERLRDLLLAESTLGYLKEMVVND